jgi:hypothetical protein
LANAIFGIIGSNKCEKHFGIYNFSNEGDSWHDVIVKIIKFTDNMNYDIQPCCSDEFYHQ